MTKKTGKNLYHQWIDIKLEIGDMVWISNSVTAHSSSKPNDGDRKATVGRWYKSPDGLCIEIETDNRFETYRLRKNLHKLIES